MSFVNTKQDSDSLDVMLRASTLPSSPSKQDTHSQTHTHIHKLTIIGEQRNRANLQKKRKTALTHNLQDNNGLHLFPHFPTKTEIQ